MALGETALSPGVISLGKLVKKFTRNYRPERHPSCEGSREAKAGLYKELIGPEMTVGRKSCLSIILGE